jgi:predicted ATPase
MKINQIRVSNLLSFSPEQVFDRFARFNLFIGKNGSGKSNILRLIGQLPTEIVALQGLGRVLKLQPQDNRGYSQHCKIVLGFLLIAGSNATKLF